MKYIKDRISVLSLIISIVVAWMLFPITTGFPMVAAAIFFIGLGSIIYTVKKQKTWTDHVLYVGIVLLSFFSIYRANEFLRFFDFLSIIAFLAFLARSLNDVPGVFRLLLSPLTVFFHTLISENNFKYSFISPAVMKQRNYVKASIPTIIVTVIVLAIALPLLASANPLFRNLLQQVFGVFHLEWLWSYIISESIGIYVLRLFALLFFTYMIPRAASVTINGVKEYGTVPTFSIQYLIPKIALAGVLIVFFVTQLQLYLASPELLESLGYTNARLTNEVFAQVTIVAFIVLLVTYWDKSRNSWNTRITYFLLLEAFFLIGIAFKSVSDYSAIFGYTQKRLWGYASMTWLSGALIAYTYHFYKQTSVQRFIKQMILYSVLVIFMINAVNFDSLIYRTAKPSHTGEIDYDYISSRSVDAHYYNEVLSKLMQDIQKKNGADQSKIQPALRMIRGIARLRNTYGQNFNINAFNVAEYQEYVATKHIDIQAYEKILLDKQQVSNQPMNSMLYPLLLPDEQIIYQYKVHVTSEIQPNRALMIDVSDANRDNTYVVPQETIIRLICRSNCPYSRILVLPSHGILEEPKDPYSSPKQALRFLMKAVKPGEAKIVITK